MEAGWELIRSRKTEAIMIIPTKYVRFRPKYTTRYNHKYRKKPEMLIFTKNLVILPRKRQNNRKILYTGILVHPFNSPDKYF